MGVEFKMLLVFFLGFIFVSTLEAVDFNGELELEIKNKQNATKEFWKEISKEAQDAFKKNKKNELKKLLDKVDEKTPMMVATGPSSVSMGSLRAFILNQIAALEFNKHGYAKCARLSEEALYYDPGNETAIKARHWALYHPHKFIKGHVDEDCSSSRIKSKALKEKKKLNSAFNKEWGQVKKIYEKAMSFPKGKREAALKKALKPLKRLCSKYEYFWARGKIDDTSNDPRYALSRLYAELAFISSEKKDRNQAVEYAKDAFRAWPNAGQLLKTEDWVFDALIILGEYKKPESGK